MNCITSHQIRVICLLKFWRGEGETSSNGPMTVSKTDPWQRPSSEIFNTFRAHCRILTRLWPPIFHQAVTVAQPARWCGQERASEPITHREIGNWESHLLEFQTLHCASIGCVILQTLNLKKISAFNFFVRQPSSSLLLAFERVSEPITHREIRNWERRLLEFSDS
jgi:hypothetical protein